jgi:hypothetical protein
VAIFIASAPPPSHLQELSAPPLISFYFLLFSLVLQ